jgi:glutamate dehydrogenase/leucine dehydrogenase
MGQGHIMNTIFEFMQKYEFENLFPCQDKAFDFKAIIAIHDSTLGSATGGCRLISHERTAIIYPRPFVYMLLNPNI